MEANAQKDVHIPVLIVNMIYDGQVWNEILTRAPTSLLIIQSVLWGVISIGIGIYEPKDNVRWKNRSRPVQQKAEGDCQGYVTKGSQWINCDRQILIQWR